MANKKRLIDANALIAAIKEETWKRLPMIQMCLEYICMIIREQPAVDAVEVVHGYWDDSGRYRFPSGKKAVRCSICGCALSEGEYNLFNWNYCPVCGAKMDGERSKDNDV